MDNFKFYASLQEQKFAREENTMITLQGFIHFMKIMGIASSRDEASNCSDCMHEIDGVTIPFTDTLNIFNGLNYAQFFSKYTNYFIKSNVLTNNFKFVFSQKGKSSSITSTSCTGISLTPLLIFQP